MAQEESAQVDEDATAQAEADTTAQDDVDPGEAGVADAVDDRAAELTGSQGAEETDAPISDINRGAVEAAEEHLDDANLSDDRETLKQLQQDM